MHPLWSHIPLQITFIVLRGVGGVVIINHRNNCDSKLSCNPLFLQDKTVFVKWIDCNGFLGNSM